MFNTVNIWNCEVLSFLILSKSHFCLVGKSVKACRARFKFWLHPSLAMRCCCLWISIFLIFKHGDKNPPLIHRVFQSTDDPAGMKFWDQACYKWLLLLSVSWIPILHYTATSPLSHVTEDCSGRLPQPHEFSQELSKYGKSFLLLYLEHIISSLNCGVCP